MVEKQPNLKLVYFDIKGKGEPIRLFCAYAGLDLEDYRLTTYDEFLAMKESGKLAFGQVPMLEVDGKVQLVQTAAILRYLSKIAGVYPEDPLVAAKVDAALDGENDAFTGPTVATYPGRFGLDLDEDGKKKFFDKIGAEIMPRHFTNAETILKNSSTGWIASTDNPTIADFVWYGRLCDSVATNENFPESLRSLNDFPVLKAFVEKMNALDAVKKYKSKE
mmetsp:Transcript_114976/g.332230  ORF Transcript_114976/g.332230 Transcript_114976/m.332230 type:complete len:220 (-) Transcript_114976:97-756(-)